ncbi:Uncharacterised protein [Bergeyella zoohelcum]|uniref:Uncharacterized protein n=1 Tax=Bergeyella zoohelcum TaxID=1015 RepID=A0A7Z9CFK6_9FLAO|nr:Uncharacterised protein [Bergeyella zoohelcum]
MSENFVVSLKFLILQKIIKKYVLDIRISILSQ